MEAALKTLGITRLEQLFTLNTTARRSLCRELSQLEFSYAGATGAPHEEGRRRPLPLGDRARLRALATAGAHYGWHAGHAAGAAHEPPPPPPPPLWLALLHASVRREPLTVGALNVLRRWALG